jgi:hypothetical protein
MCSEGSCVGNHSNQLQGPLPLTMAAAIGVPAQGLFSPWFVADMNALKGGVAPWGLPAFIVQPLHDFHGEVSCPIF